MKKFILLLCAVSLTLVSCNKQQDLNNSTDQPSKKTYSVHSLTYEDIATIHNQAMDDCLPDDDAQDTYDNLIESLDAQIYDQGSTDIVDYLDHMGYTYTYFSVDDRTYGETPTEWIASTPSAIQSYLANIFDELDEATTLEAYLTALGGIKSSVIANTSLTSTEEAIVLSVLSIAEASSTYWNGLSESNNNKTFGLNARDRRVIKADVTGAGAGALWGAESGALAGAGVGAVPGAIFGACIGAALNSAGAGLWDYFGF